jgi:arylsulfatase A-like enzyme
VWGSGRAAGTHGQPSDLDAHVPLIFWGREIQRGIYPGRVSAVDLAPTLARLLDVPPTQPLDGRVLTSAIAHQESRQP